MLELMKNYRGQLAIDNIQLSIVNQKGVRNG
jgi:hypothetical protein